MSTEAVTYREGKARSGVMLLLGSGADVLMPFVRSVALAHLIAPSEFGLAIALAAAIGFADLMADLGLHNSAMRHGGSDTEDALPTLHTILLIRSTIVGAVLALAGAPLAHLFQAPDAAWSFSVLGLAAFMRGFMHLQISEMMRSYVFGPGALANIAHQLVWTVVTVGAAIVLGDYRSMLFGLLAGSVTWVLASHLLSPSPWRLGWSPAVGREALTYGAPLIPNGLALAAASLGDRFLIGSLLNLAALALYNVGSTAAFMPRGVVTRLLMSVALPTFLTSGDEGSAAGRVFDYWAVALALTASLYSLAFLCVGSILIGLVFGSGYSLNQDLASLFAISVYLKYMATLPVPPALAFGQTRFILATSVLAALAIGCGALAMLVERDLVFFMRGIVAGELLALLWVVAKSIRLYAFTRSVTWFVTLFPLAVLAGADAASIMLASDTLVARIELFAVAGLITVAGFGAIMVAAAIPLVPSFLKRA
jgi:PST family polysaccharide transporter